MYRYDYSREVKNFFNPVDGDLKLINHSLKRAKVDPGEFLTREANREKIPEGLNDVMWHFLHVHNELDKYHGIEDETDFDCRIAALLIESVLRKVGDYLRRLQDDFHVTLADIETPEEEK